MVKRSVVSKKKVKSSKKTSSKKKRVKASPKKSVSKKIEAKSVKKAVKHKSSVRKSRELNDNDWLKVIVVFIASIFQLPGVGHILIGQTKKGITYNIALWLVWLVSIFLLVFIIPGLLKFLCAVFLLAIPFLLSFVIFADFYKMLKNEGEFLPPVI